eukprot:8555437-Pyramimonas_sp.AAC.1
MANSHPKSVACPFRCRTTSLYSIAPDSSQVPMRRNRSHSACSALRASWFTAASAPDTGRATAAELCDWLTSAGICVRLFYGPNIIGKLVAYIVRIKTFFFHRIMEEVVLATAMA